MTIQKKINEAVKELCSVVHTPKKRKPKQKKVRCYWCGKFLSEDNRRATVRNPDTFYCSSCYRKGLDMEEEAMGMYDPNYAL